ncbi:MAG TPA: DUF4097 family beta strand repeat-containing protein [Gemmatimonadales bacterium]|jgi:DUF4097 and DUF4098 domain-containing protein YvlB
MRTALILTLALSGAIATGLVGQRSRRPAPDRSRSDQSTSQDDYHFTPDLRSGQRLSVSNIDGEVVVTQSRGTAAEITAHKIVHRGDGSRVKAVLEQTDGGYRVCTVYLGRNDNSDDRTSCSRGHSDNGNDDNEPLEVEMRYDIRLPAGVELAVNTVDGDVHATGLDVPVTIRTVDGNVTVDGVAPQSVNTVDGKITATITDTRWDHDLAIRSVDGAVDLTLPATIGLAISGETVDGEVHSDFPLTLQGHWGPRSFNATIGGGGSHQLHLNTVDGSITLHQGGRRQGDGRNH